MTGGGLEAAEAIRSRRSVGAYTGAPVDERTVDRLLRLALLAPTESMAQAWSFIVVRERRGELADLVVRGGGEYFRVMRPPAGPARGRPRAQRARLAEHERTAQVMSLAFAIENLMVAARAAGLGTLPTNFHGHGGGRVPRPPRAPARGRGADHHSARVSRRVPRLPATGARRDPPPVAVARAR